MGGTPSHRPRPPLPVGSYAARAAPRRPVPRRRFPPAARRAEPDTAALPRRCGRTVRPPAATHRRGRVPPPAPPPHPTRAAAAGRATRPASRPGRPPLPPPSRFLPRPPSPPAERPWWWWLGPSPRPAHPVSFLFEPSPSRASGGRPAILSLLLPPPLPPPLFFLPVAFLLSTHRRPPILHLPLFFFGHHPPRPAAPHRATLSARRLRAAPVGLWSPLCRRRRRRCRQLGAAPSVCFLCCAPINHVPPTPRGGHFQRQQTRKWRRRRRWRRQQRWQ